MKIHWNHISYKEREFICTWSFEKVDFSIISLSLTFPLFAKYIPHMDSAILLAACRDQWDNTLQRVFWDCHDALRSHSEWYDLPQNQELMPNTHWQLPATRQPEKKAIRNHMIHVSRPLTDFSASHRLTDQRIRPQTYDGYSALHVFDWGFLSVKCESIHTLRFPIQIHGSDAGV